MLVSQSKGRGFDPEIYGCILKQTKIPLTFQKVAVAPQELSRGAPGVGGLPWRLEQILKIAKKVIVNVCSFITVLHSIKLVSPVSLIK